MKRASRGGWLRYEVVDLRDYAVDGRGTVDGTPYGGGEGMVMRPDVLAASVESHPHDYIITTSPGGDAYFSQQEARKLYDVWQNQDLCFICGRFSGIDERFIQSHVHRTWSLGDFVCSGGELPSLLIAETITRLIPGLLGDERSVTEDSFGSCLPAGSLRAPVYTQPRQWQGLEVPQVLLSGNHQAIQEWRKEKAQQRTRSLPQRS